MKSIITNARTNKYTHLLLRICDDDDDCDWGYRVYGVQGAHETVICEGGDRIVAAALTSDRIAICTASDPNTLQVLAIPSKSTLHTATLDTAITRLSITDDNVTAATMTHLHVYAGDLRLLHVLESPNAKTHSLASRYVAYVHPPIHTTTSGIVAAKNFRYADRPGYTTAEIASHVASYIEEGYKQGFHVLRDAYYSKSVPLTSPAMDTGAAASADTASPSLSLSPAALAEQNGLFNRNPSLVRVCDIVTGRTAALFEASIANLSCISLSPSGRNVLVADCNAHTFHIYELRPRPVFDINEYDSVWHRYALSRGYTTARVTAVAWTADERWVGITTDKGTTHVYPINPNTGGNITEAHVNGSAIGGARFAALSTPLSSLVKVKCKPLEDQHGIPRSVSFAFADCARGVLSVYMHDNDADTFTRQLYNLSWRERKGEDDLTHMHLHAALDCTSDVSESRIDSQNESHKSLKSQQPHKATSQMARGEIETFDVSNLRSIFASRQFEFRSVPAEVMRKYANDLNTLIDKAVVYKVRPQVKMDRKDSDAGDMMILDHDDKMDLSAIQHVIPALPNGVEHKSSLSLPDQHTLKKILRGSYKKISSTFGSPNSGGLEYGHEEDGASVEDDGVHTGISNSEEADRFVVGLVDDDEEELEGFDG
ncbi:hypothetical protein E3P99_02657 [Wallemia hederae]|uniref:BCAS3 WD40 domain-containing protein n=1 Tax=Wallemia hederae TaxID=1540922 RepID=A0A4T0FKZ9_9BASI|nr:hypothetical protein E3P99_02657 [Wallemia hederae]